MHIPSHQIHNVLKAYKRLIMNKKGNGGKAFMKASAAYASKRRAVIEKIIRDISGRIMLSEAKAQHKARPAAPAAGEEANQLVYNTITAANGKITQRIAVEAADFLIKSLDMLAAEDQAGPDRENA